MEEKRKTGWKKEMTKEEKQKDEEFWKNNSMFCGYNYLTKK